MRKIEGCVDFQSPKVWENIIQTFYFMAVFMN